MARRTPKPNRLLTAMALVALAVGAHAAVASGERVAGVRFDFAGGTVEVEAAGAADRSAPGPDVARVKAERTARQVAARRLVQALASVAPERLGCKPPALEQVQKLAAAAPTSSIDWGSDGSVRLTVRIGLPELCGRGGSTTP